MKYLLLALLVTSAYSSDTIPKAAAEGFWSQTPGAIGIDLHPELYHKAKVGVWKVELNPNYLDMLGALVPDLNFGEWCLVAALALIAVARVLRWFEKPRQSA